uniref:Uncharacterized protein n=1 Tax=Salix viminalis TaxID=40686 RepID=A0A6N2MIC4_SALVM
MDTLPTQGGRSLQSLPGCTFSFGIGYHITYGKWLSIASSTYNFSRYRSIGCLIRWNRETINRRRKLASKLHPSRTGSSR